MYLKDKYKNEILKDLATELDCNNVMQLPKLEKIVLNMGIWTYIRAWNKDFSQLQEALALISGQQPVVRYAKKSISNFKLREWMPVGLTVTLRWDAMYVFLEKLVNIVLPRVRDFRWISKKSFDNEWNYNFWIKEHTIFPEVPQDDVVKSHWLQITIKTKSRGPDDSRLLLEKMGLPFKK